MKFANRVSELPPYVFATMAGNFNDDSIPGKVQYGTAWWFLDQKDGIEKQLASINSRQQQLQKELDAIAKQQDEMKKKMDSMSEMSETTAMRLQLCMERRQKAYEMLSNIMKKMHDTQMSIIQNMK